MNPSPKRVAKRYIQAGFDLQEYHNTQAEKVRKTFPALKRECVQLAEEITRIRRRASNIAEDLENLSKSAPTNAKDKKVLTKIVKEITFKDMLRLNGMGAISRALAMVDQVSDKP